MGSGSMNVFAKKLSKSLEKDIADFWVSLVEKGKQNGEINPKLDSRHAAYVIDNNILLFIFALISEHHKNRFVTYFGNDYKAGAHKKRFAIVENNINTYLSKQ